MKKSNSSYSQLLKAGSILGSSQLVNIILRLVRTKAIAILLGPAGIGLIGVFQSIIDMLCSFWGLGLTPGAVKEISQAPTEGNQQTKGKAVYVFRQWFTITACLGALACLLNSYILSEYFFSDQSYTPYIALLSICVFLTIITSGRTAILQGLRKIPSMAKASILESAIGLLLVVAVYYYFGEKGIIPAFIINSVIVFLCINFYYRRSKVKPEVTKASETINVGLKALRLGIFLTLGACVSTASMFIVRFLYADHVETLGVYQSVWTITNVFAGLVIGAFGTDYFTRLCAVSDNNVKSRTLINEQSYIIVTLSAPLIIGIILYSDGLLTLLFSSNFSLGKTMLQWQSIGIFLKIVSTPIASLLLAKQKGWLYIISEIAFFACYLLFSFILVPQLGIEGSGIAYLVSYILYLIIIVGFGYQIIKYKWSSRLIALLTINSMLIVGAFFITKVHSHYHFIAISVVLLMLSIAFSVYLLTRVFSLAQVKDWFDKKK